MSKYFPYGVVGPSTIPDVADKILNECFEIFTELNLRACLCFGLCLGFVRDGGYIEGDNDLDLVVISQTGGLMPNLMEAMTAHGFTLKQTYPPPPNNVHFIKDGILVDIYLRTGGEYIDQFDEVRYKGSMYPIPSPIGAYLTECYGDWKTKADEETKYYG